MSDSRTNEDVALRRWGRDGHTYLIKPAGHRKPYLAVNIGQSACGDITDGVSVAHWGTDGEYDSRLNDGGWVISFAALEAWYLAAKAHRSALEKTP